MLTLGEVLASYPRVVFDTSVLRAEKSVDAAYRCQFSEALDDRRLITVSDVVSEAWTWLRHVDREFYKRIRRRSMELGSVQVEYHGFLHHLLHKAEALGVIDSKKNRPMTDVKVAALAMTLAVRSPVALISSDRRLNELVESERRNPSLPLKVHPIDVYSMIQQFGAFVPYEAERKKMPFISSRNPSRADRREPVREDPAYNTSSPQ